MKAFLERARKALLDFQEQAGLLHENVGNTRPSRQLPEKRLRKIADLAVEATSASIPLLDSLDLIEKTSLDVVDMETRMMRETTHLAGTLSELGKEVREQFFIRETFGEELIELEERAQLVAGALFPSAVQALNFVNSKIWEFSRRQMTRYRRILNEGIQSEELGGVVLERIQQTFSTLESHFDNANRFLNEVARRELTRHGVIMRRAFVRRALDEARGLATQASEEKPLRRFRSVLRDTRGVAAEVRERIDALQIPLFPAHDELEELQPLIDRGLYDSLTGLQTFALLNIASRMRQIERDGRHLLSPEFEIQVWKLFPDRIYFDADPAFLRTVEDTGQFESADPSLHRFRQGSLKQKTYPMGNLQLSYQTNASGRMSFDADIDLYRDPVAHFFGEVFVNHLTGGKTDPYKVRKILDDQDVRPLGGFEVYRA